MHRALTSHVELNNNKYKKNRRTMRGRATITAIDVRKYMTRGSVARPTTRATETRTIDRAHAQRGTNKNNTYSFPAACGMMSDVCRGAPLLSNSTLARCTSTVSSACLRAPQGAGHAWFLSLLLSYPSFVKLRLNIGNDH